MVAGHLQEKKGYFYMVLTFRDAENKPKTKWISTKLTVKGNKKRAENMLLETRRKFETPKQITEGDLLFADYMMGWLEMVKDNIELTTYASYSNAVKVKIYPYFKEQKVRLNQLQPKHIQDFYLYCSKEYQVSANTIIHYHANIRKALQYAVKTDLLMKNPADQIDRPKANKFVGSFYDKDEIAKLLEAVKGTKIELAVMLASFYGLRRSEVIGLKWEAIDFNNKTISIRHTVTQVTVDGVNQIVTKDRTKNQSSRRTLPLVGQIETILKQLYENQKEYKYVCKSCYNYDYDGYLNVDEMGNLLKPNFLSDKFKQILEKNNLRKIRFHDLRHSCASLLLVNGVSMKDIQEWLGHSDFGTTANIYTHLDYNQKVNSANVMDEIISF